ncbi:MULTISPECIES: hypothetical protein [Methylococcus]|uniref:Hemolytic protein HlpA-like protein n=1 Tax=Methylococcus capsulatus TaxID=414 RepID=A0ABZ2F1L7_METCP|nr:MULTISPECIES: hypothetical protein [Methylococcus]MDF9393874.1 nucleotide-diphospho-sugar transferase [Methylococcus capsulatus]
MYKTRSPVLQIVFNRPNETRAVFQAVSIVQPERLYVAADAPRKNKLGEHEKCAETLSIFEEVDWPCQIFFKVNESNLGSHTSIPQAVDWFFDNEEEGIVLEDDCVPSESFFRYCDELLERYRGNQNVMWINGSNVGYKSSEQDPQYLYSAYAIPWGWASWRTAWLVFGPEYRQSFPNIRLASAMQHGLGNSSLTTWLYWKYIFDYAYSVKNWDFRWQLALWANRGLACTPTVNLVSNIGFGIEGMHGGRCNDPRANIPVEEISGVIEGPEDMVVSTKLDYFLNRNLYKINPLSISKAFLASRIPQLRNAVRKFKRLPT